jgi:dTDP-4-dehydrorhamnose 3,5-epimerase
MEFERLAIPEVILLKPKVFGDKRGFFMESWNQEVFDRIVGEPIKFVQDNHSRSTKGVLRGLHYQLPPMAQGKLVRVTRGEVFDVAVDIRRSSPTFGKWVGAILSDENQHQLWIPPGFAHGFLTLSETADFLYKTTAFYSKEFERGIRWNDSTIALNWPLSGSAYSLSEKDCAASEFLGANFFE